MPKVFQVDTGETLTTSLISYYKREDATDFYGSNNGTDSSVTTVAGKVNNAGSYNGTSSKTHLADTGFQTGSGARSISCWLYIPTTVPSNRNLNFFDYGTGANYQAFSAEVWTCAGGPKIGVDIYTEEKVIATAFAADTWYHIVITLTGTTLEVFKNNVSIGTATF